MTKTKKILELVTFESLQWCIEYNYDNLNSIVTWHLSTKKILPRGGWVSLLKVKIVHLFIIFLPSCPKISFFPISGSYLEKFEAGHIKLLEAVG